MRNNLSKFYDKHGEKLRFLAVGVLNTGIAYVLFVAAIWLFSAPLQRLTGFDVKVVALIIQWAAWVFSVVLSTSTMKYLVFHSKGKLVTEVLRAYLIYLPAQGISSLILWAGMSFLKLSAPLAQLIAVFIVTIFSYFGHKYFTFRSTGDSSSEEDTMEGNTNV